jgi:hypothetical protein
MGKDVFDKGMEIRKSVLGAEFVKTETKTVAIRLP